MRKLAVFIIGMILLLQQGYAQSAKQAQMEDFDGSSISFSISPQNSWLPDATFYLPNASGTNSISYLGRVSNRAGYGDTSVLTTGVYDFSNYPYVFLRFSHICKVSPCDIARVEYCEEMGGGGVFGPWTAIPASAYRGNAANYPANLVFNASSYPEWKASDSTLMPNQSWWRDELFDLENQAGYGKVKFRFFLQRENVAGTQISYGWLVENVELLAMKDRIAPPTVRFIEPLIKDTMYFAGPFQINAEVKTNSIAPIEAPWLKYMVRQGKNLVKFDSLLMTHVSGNAVWETTIPQFEAGTEVTYSVKGRDTAGNDASANSFYVVAKPIGNTGNIILQGDGSVSSNYPFSTLNGYSRAMALFTVDEIPPQANTQITSIALRAAVAGGGAIPIRIWLKTVPASKTEWNDADDDYAWNVATQDAVEVYSGNFQFSPAGWVDIPLNHPYRYSRQENLVVMFEHNCGGTSCNSYSNPLPLFYNKTLLSNRFWLIYQDGSAPVDANMLTLSQNRPDIRLGTVNASGNHSAAPYYINVNDTVPTSPTQMTPIVVTVKNKGSQNLDSVEVSYTLNKQAAITKMLYTPSLPWGFDYKDTLGYYNAKVEGYDTITVWTKMPNGQPDAVIWDDTMKARIYGGKDIRINFVKFPKDTVYGTGPFEVAAKIQSLSGYPISDTVYMVIATTVSSVTTYDTVIMLREGSGVWATELPCQPYNSTVNYSIQMIDALGNTVTVSKRYVIRSLSSGTVIAGTGATQNYYTPINLASYYSWSRELYLSEEINPTSGELTITRLAWHYNSLYATNKPNQKCYFKIVSDTVMSSSAYIDPVADGATLVWSGTYNVGATLAIALRWVEVTLNTSFRLPAGKNLMVYWTDESNEYASSSYTHRHTLMPNNMTAYGYSSGSFSSAQSSSNISKARPNARFTFTIPSTSANSVAMDAIVSPQKMANAGAQTPVIVRIRNKGTNGLDSCYIGWKLDGVTMPTVVYRNANKLARDYADTITLGTCYQTFGANEIIAWVSMPNNAIDPVTSDDTLELTSMGCSPAATFTVGIGRDFPTIRTAIATLRQCGVSKNITLTLKGTFDESIDLTNLSNWMNGYHLTITSAGNNPDSAIIRPTTGNYGITLGNTKELTIKAITVNARTTGTHGVYFSAACTNVVIRDCRILSDTVTTASIAPIYKPSGGISDRISFINNWLDGGYYGWYFYGGTSSSAYGTSIVFDSNTLTNQHYHGTYPYYLNFTSCNYNTILSRRANVNSYWYPLRMYYVNGPAIGNRMIQRSTAISYPYGIYSYYHNYYNQGSNRGLIANNELILNSTSGYYGIYCAYNNADIYHNSIYFTGNTSNYGIYLTTNSNATIKNNNIYMAGSSAYPIYYSSGFLTSDYNNLYAPQYVGYYNGARTTIAAWQSVVPSDLHSVRMMPNFTDPTINLKMNVPIDVSFFCLPITGTTTDIDKAPRGGSLTTMGCYEAIAPRQLNASLFEISGLRQGSILGQTDTLKVTILNTGSTPLSSINLEWSLNGIPQSAQPYPLTPSLNFGNTRTFVLDTINYPVGNVEVKVWSNGVNGGVLDNYQGDDTLTKSTYICTNGYSGLLTVGPDASNDFNSIEDVYDALKLCGVIGDITLAFESGVYDRAFDFTNTSTVFGNHALTITSQDNDADSVIFRPASDGYGITLGNSNNVAIKDITVDARTNMAYYGIFLNNACTNIVIQNCKILHDTLTTSSSYAAIYKNSTGVINGFQLTGCFVEGGYYNVYFYGGTGNTIAGLAKNVVWDNNVFKSSYYNALYPQYTYFTSISHNTLLGRIGTAIPTYWYALYIYTGCHVEDVIGNRILQRGVTSYMYGLYLSSANLTTVIPNRRPTMIVNNEIIGTTFGSTTYGIYLNNTGKSTDPPIYVLHNSVYFGGTGAGATYGIYLTSVPSGQMNVVKNNMIQLTGTAAAVYPINLNTAFSTTIYDVDYNNMYAPTNVGYVAGASPTARPDIVSWQDVVTTDQNSISVLPDFIDPANSLKLTTAGFNDNSLRCPMIQSVITDINSNLRPANVTMGAYERQIPSDYYDLMALQIPQTITEVVDKQPVSISVDVWNVGAVSIDSATFGWSINGEVQPAVSYNFVSSLNSYDKENVPIGIFTAKDTTDHYDVVVWIETLNNGLIDTLTWNNTVSAAYQVVPLAEFTAPFVKDTITALNFAVRTYIYEGSGAVAPTPPYMVIRTIVGECMDIIDSVALVKENDMWTARIPKQFYNSKVIYSLHVSDDLGNVVDLMDSVFIALSTNGTGTEVSDVYSGNNLGIISLVSPVNTAEASCEYAYSSLKVALANLGGNNYDFTQNNVTIYYEVIAPQQTIYRGNVLINRGGLLSKKIDTVELISNIPMFAGIFDITTWLSSSIDNFPCDDTLTYIYLSEKTGLPVYEDFSDTVLREDFISISLVGENAWELYQPDINDPAPNTGTGVLRHTGGIGTMAQLSTRQLDLLGTVNPKLEFWYYHDTATLSTDRTSMDVYVVADGITTLVSTVFKRDTALHHGWKQYQIDLNPFTNAQCVLIQFETTNRRTQTQYLDLVYIYAEQNLALDTILIPSLALCDFKNKDIQVVLHNTSGQRIDFINNNTQIYLEVKKGNTTINSTILTLNTGSIESYERDTVTFLTMDLDTGIYSLSAWVVISIDNNSSDDTTRRTLVINPDIAIKGIPNTEFPDVCFPMNASATQTVTIENKGNFDVYDIPLTLEIHSGKDGLLQSFKDTLKGVLTAGTSRTKVFSQAYDVPLEDFYNVIVKAALSCDAASNDNIDNLPECVDFKDIEVVEIITPSGQQPDNVGDAVNLTVKLRNNSPYNAFAGIKIHAIVDNVPLPIGTVNLTAGQDTIYKFTTPYTVPAVKEYTIIVFVENQDANPLNDTIGLIIRSTNVGITPISSKDFLLGQNIPNPAKENTRIEYNLPEDGQVIFTVYSITGQTLHIEKRDASSGKNNIEFNTLNLANGIYYYSMEYKGERLVKKMTIRK